MAAPDLATRIRNAWSGRIAGCMLGKAVELTSMREGGDVVRAYLEATDALPLRGWVPHDPERAPRHLDPACCAGGLQDGSVPDDDINYAVLALMLLEKHGAALTTADVARAWLRHLPLASTYTAERAAYRTLLAHMDEWFPEGRDPGFDLSLCSDNPYNNWIGAQIRADLYGWVCPGNPALAARLVTEDATLSHQGDGVNGALFVAVTGALVAGGLPLQPAVEDALGWLPPASAAAEAVHLGISAIPEAEGGVRLRRHYGDMSPVHTVNNLALVVWALLRHQDNFSAAIGEVVAAGLDTDCNGATVGALWGLQGKPLPLTWLNPWAGRVGVSLAGQAELRLDDLVIRTLAVAADLGA